MGRETMGAKQALRKETLVLQKKEYWILVQYKYLFKKRNINKQF